MGGLCEYEQVHSSTLGHDFGRKNPSPLTQFSGIDTNDL